MNSEWCRFDNDIAANILYLFHIDGKLNPSDVLTKFLSWAKFWPLIQPFLFWKGETIKEINPTTPITAVISHITSESPSGLWGVTSTNQVSPSDRQSGNTTSKTTKKNKFSLDKSPLPSIPLLEIPLGNAFMNIQTSENIPSIPQNGTLRSAEYQPTNLVGLENISDESEPPNSVGLNKITLEHNMTQMRTVPSVSVLDLQDQSHPENTVQNLHGWTVISHRPKKVSPH